MPAMQGKEGIRGKFWFVDSDLKGGSALKLDKTGKAILTVLRHLGRLTEVCSLVSVPSQIACTNLLPYAYASAYGQKQFTAGQGVTGSVVSC